MESQRKALNVCAQKLSLGLVWRELQVFSKLLYRGRNQHRRDKSYQKLTRVSKELKVYQEVALANYVKKLVKLVGSSSDVTHSVATQGAELAAKLVDSARFIVRLVEFIKDTFREVDLRLHMSLFIPFNVLMVSSLSRIWYCLHHHLLAISETYGVVKQSLLPSSKNFLPSLADYLSKKQSRTYLSIPKGQQLQNSDVGMAMQRIHQILPASVESVKDKMEEQRAVLQEMDAVMTNLPKINEHQLEPLSSDDEEEEEDLISEPVVAETVTDKPAATTKAVEVDTQATGEQKRNVRGRKRANTLTFQFHYGRRKSIKMCLRGRKLLSALSLKNLSVTSVHFKNLKRIPTGYHVASTFSLTFSRWNQPIDPSPCRLRRPQTTCSYSTAAVCSGVREREAMGCSHSWMEVERNRLTQRSDSTRSSSCVHQLQNKLTEDLDSVVDAATDTVVMETDSEHDTNDLLVTCNDRGKLIDNNNEIDDIFGALDGL